MAIVARISLDSNFPSQFSQDVEREIIKKIKSKAPKIKISITDQIKKNVREALIGTQEYQSIIHGRLRAELGIPNSSSRIMSVVDTWVDNIVVKVTTGKSPFLSINIGMIQADYSDVLALPEAQYTYKSRRSEGTIPWLRWLLLEGPKRIITQYEFSKSPIGSRTGMGIMISKERGAWQVPSEFSGTSVNNFATRALGNMESVIDKIVENTVKGRFK